MIENIFLANEGAYSAEGAQLNELKSINYIFGANGSGKTTISQVIESPSVAPDCRLDWKDSMSLETLVYNKFFVEKHFGADSNLKGIYTFRENIEAAEEIERLKQQRHELQQGILRLQQNLDGTADRTGKRQEFEEQQQQFEDLIWEAKRPFDDLKEAFAGCNHKKAAFRAHYLNQVQSNQSDLLPISDLRTAAETVFADSLEEATLLRKPNPDELLTCENDQILGKKIIGKDDVDIAGMINHLGNSAWVNQGRGFLEQTDGTCPFCQQQTNAEFRRQLEDYFDESYRKDLEAIDELLDSYKAAHYQLLQDYQVLSVETALPDRAGFERDMQTLDGQIQANLAKITGKKDNAEQPVSLISSHELIQTLDRHIDAANEKIRETNETLQNLAARQEELSGRIWRRLLEDSREIYNFYRGESQKLTNAISGMETALGRKVRDLQDVNGRIEAREREITSIKPAIDQINKLLFSFGFTNFKLEASSKEGFYEILRPDGSKAKATLSEGEKSFITFLYFYFWIRGSFEQSGSTADRVVVFDDPVSSLDSDILFIVSSLIKAIMEEVRTGNGAIKQVFVLTHNIYFHKEITFHKNRPGGRPFREESFWIVRKLEGVAELKKYPENPIKSSYELLWQEIRRVDPSSTAIQNAMRRILEHYFKFYGNVSQDELIDRFEGKEKLICGSLFSWINDGSHFANDELFMSCEPELVERYRSVFQRVFEYSQQLEHYKMMMGSDYVDLLAIDQELDLAATGD